MKKTGLFLLSILLIMTILSACGKAKDQAEPINEETDKCAICNMQIKDDAFAVQLKTKDGKTYKFDDLGCMNEWKGKNAADSIQVQFVRDYNNKEWIKYEDATYVYDPSFKSPMAYGVYSFKDKAEAQKFADSQKKGKVMTAADLGKHTWEQNKSMMNMGGSHDHSVTPDAGGGKDAHGGQAGDQGTHGK